jgi:hypothetical protein
MPTTRQRFTVTATDELTRALDEAALRWPEQRDQPTRLLLHLVAQGYASIQHEREAARDADLAVLNRAAGALTGAYQEGYLEELRADWPR